VEKAQGSSPGDRKEFSLRASITARSSSRTWSCPRKCSRAGVASRRTVVPQQAATASLGVIVPRRPARAGARLFAVTLLFGRRSLHADVQIRLAEMARRITTAAAVAAARRLKDAAGCRRRSLVAK